MSINALSKLFKDEMATVAAIGAASQYENKLGCGDPSLNWCIGGWSLNRPNLIFGPSGCLDKDTHINYHIVSADGKIQNKKGGTIENLFKRFHQLPRAGKGAYQRKQTLDSRIKITSVGTENQLIRNDVVDVIFSGIKETFEMKSANGFSIIATADHKFLSNGEYKRLGDLHEGDSITVFDVKSKKKKNKTQFIDYKELFVKYHPSKKYKHIKQGKNTYSYCRVAEHRAVVEAQMNSLSLKQYVELLNTESPAIIDMLRTLPDTVSVHHINENKRDNRIENLEVMEHGEHTRKHMEQNPLFSHSHYASEDRIISITPAGERPTYDIKCAYPFNNFLANNMVVHNSGKSALAAMAAGFAQKKRPGSVVVFNDTEFYYHEQPERIQRLAKYGLDIDNTMIISGNTIDDAFGRLAQIEGLLKDGKVDISAWVIDSWQGIENLSAAKKLDENKNGEGASDAGNAHRGNAKAMNPILTRILGLAAKYKITVLIVQHVMINQDQYGSKFLLLGGEKLRHLCDSILFVESIQAKDAKLNADGEVAGQDDLVVGKKIRAKGEKTRNTVEGKKVEFWMNFEECRFAKPEESLMTLAENLGVVYTPFDLELDSEGQPAIDKKTGKPKKKEQKGYYEVALESGTVTVYGRPKMLEKLKDKSVFVQVQKLCMESTSINASKENKSEDVE